MTKEVWKQALADHSGQWAFVLSISRRMVFFLRLIRDGEYHKEQPHGSSDLRARNHFIGTTGSLESRGLIERVMRDGWKRHDRDEMVQILDWRLTPAGELVCQLLVFAGLMAEKKRRRIKEAA